MRMMKSLKMDLTKPFSQSDLIGLTAWVILGIQSSVSMAIRTLSKDGCS
jgi:acyl-CoA hydrolase